MGRAPYNDFAMPGQTMLDKVWAHLLPAMQGWWKDLGQPEVTPVLQQRLAEGVAEEAAGRSVEDLARWRDEALVRLLVAREAKGG